MEPEIIVFARIMERNWQIEQDYLEAVRECMKDQLECELRLKLKFEAEMRKIDEDFYKGKCFPELVLSYFLLAIIATMHKNNRERYFLY
jgi:hypothetical protein